MHKPTEKPKAEAHQYNDMFVWNHFLRQNAFKSLKENSGWCTPVIHGFIDQANISLYGQSIYLTLVARRSRYFAGARYLKRGANDEVCAIELLTSTKIAGLRCKRGRDRADRVPALATTSFHSPGAHIYTNPSYTSFVQHRGSIPLFWSQEVAQLSTRPPIELNVVDPFFKAAAMHFDQLFQRYGKPITILNVIKAKERVPRESILLSEYTQAINYLNQFLPECDRLRHIAWDMARAAKTSRNQEVTDMLEQISKDVVLSSGFFHNGYLEGDKEKRMTLQQGICRTNCIDCLDRTNACQFVIAKRALGYQLHALGVLEHPSVSFDTDAVNLLTEMFQDHGDTMALQYGGSQLVNTVETYRKINQWKSHSRDLIESIRRFYSNSFVDAQRQEAINLFLGNYKIAQNQPTLWELTTDYYLHHYDPTQNKKKRSYLKWWTREDTKELPIKEREKSEYKGDYWEEYYKPESYSTLQRIFSFNINSTLRYSKVTGPKDSLGPFTFRVNQLPQENGNEIPASVEEVLLSPGMPADGKASLHRWVIDGKHHKEQEVQKDTHEKYQIFQPSTLQPLPNVLSAYAAEDFSVSIEDELEYGRYIRYPESLANIQGKQPQVAKAPIRYAADADGTSLQKHSTSTEDVAAFTYYVNIPKSISYKPKLALKPSKEDEARRKVYRAYLGGEKIV